ncbi:reverse transcriptase domain-containing protein, partial [Brevibacillus brevis]|uniref:reverse transcriptase domain-containing protein n=1 Tax=Brevibacillus brevis TaxID=1393 RepID=UPI0037CC8446
MARTFSYPKNETELRQLLDALFDNAKRGKESGKTTWFYSLLEIVSSETVILSAIHNIKSNHGSQTAGVDEKTMQDDYLQQDYESVIREIQSSFRSTKYHPHLIRRVWIPKPNTNEKRPLGIPTVRDRIMQECIRITIEPILEAQFLKHSYGFRPWRDTKMALERVNQVIHKTGYHWIIEGDISKFFDTVDHNVLLKRLWQMGIRDRRLLIIIKKMLQAGIMDE